MPALLRTLCLFLLLSFPAMAFAETTAKDIGESVGETVNTTGDYIAESKDSFVNATKEKLDDLDAKIDDMQEGFSNSSDRSMKKLKKAKRVAGERFDNLKDAAGDSWDDAKESMDNAMDSLFKTYNETLEKMKKD